MQRIVVQHSKCTGCRICQLVCSNKFNEGGYNSKEAAVRVYTKEHFEADIPVLCRQCKKAPCQENCPVGAFYRDENTGALLIKADQCIGCGKCVEVCPFGAIFLHEAHITPIKCDLCGGAPRCVARCPNGVLTLRDETSLGDEQKARLKTLLAGG